MSSPGLDLSPGQPYLPPELILCIIENCDKSLPDCSLVSQTWHSITAPLLYSRLSVRLGGRDEDLSEFLSFLQEGTCLACHVNSFKVKNGHSNVYQLIRLFGYFPHLQDLTIDNMDLTPALVADLTPTLGNDPPVRPSLPIPYLRSLTLHHNNVSHCGDPWSPLFDLISSFSVIDKLVLESLWSQYYYGPPPDRFTSITPGGKAKIGELVFAPESGKNAEEFVDAMAEHLDVTQVHTLGATQWYKRDLFKRVLATLGSVKHFRSLTGGISASYYIHLPVLQSLESITFSINFSWLRSDEWGDSFEQLYKFFSASIEALSSISRVAGNQLSTVRYEFGQSLVQQCMRDRFWNLKQGVKDLDWLNLESILNKDRFRKLQMVEVSFAVPNDDMSIARYPRREAEGRGVLVGIVEDRLSGLTKECTVNVWVREE